MTSSDRLESLDVFRGLTVAGMILVNTPGTWDAVYLPLEHAAWHGWTPADLVFPFFLFAMGAAIPFAMARRRGHPRLIRRHVIRRALILFALGLLLNAISGPMPLDWRTFRIPGVLQRIAVVYLVVTWLTEMTSRRTQMVVAVACLAGYWAALTLIPVPGFGAGDLTPTGNLVSAIDRWIFGRHLLRGTWDPEGLLSTIPAIATALAGVFAGDWLKRPGRHRSLTLSLAGIAAIGLGLLWDRVFPINKNLWTSSFVLFTAGGACQLLALCHWLLDVKRWRGWEAPFLAFGRNPLAAYFLSVGLDAILTDWAVPGYYYLKNQIFTLTCASWIAPRFGLEAASAFYACAYVVLWGTVVYVMYRRRIFIGI